MTTATDMTRDDFWTLVKTIGWGTKTTDSQAVKVTLMRKGLAFCEAYGAHVDALHCALEQAACDAGYDYCNDSWSDTLNHVIGLGRDEYKANLDDPYKLVGRDAARDYTESFGYCTPWKGDFETYSEEGLQTRSQAVAAAYREGKGKVEGLDADLDRLADLLEGDTLSQETEVRALAEHIQQTAQKVGLWGWHVMTNKWAAWNLCSDLRTALQLHG